MASFTAVVTTAIHNSQIANSQPIKEDAMREVHPKSCTDLTCVYCDTLDQLKHHLKGGAFIGTERRDEPVG